MAISYLSSGSAVDGKALDSMIERVQLLCKILCSDKDFVPCTAFLGQPRETLRGDPFNEANECRVDNFFRDTRPEFGCTSISKHICCVLHKH